MEAFYFFRALARNHNPRSLRHIIGHQQKLVISYCKRAGCDCLTEELGARPNRDYFIS